MQRKEEQLEEKKISMLEKEIELTNQAFKIKEQ